MPYREKLRNYVPSDENSDMTNVVMTPDQLQQLLAGIREMVVGSTQQNPTANSGNFAKCSSRFAGRKDEDVEAFISAITVYKECINITDVNALKGLPMLLDSHAAVWWQGTKSSVTTWTDFLTALRHEYGKKKSAPKIFRELFSKEQGEKERTDVFVNNCRALLSHLPDTPVLHKIDMIYSLLHAKLRERLPRSDVTTLDVLIDKARAIKDFLAEQDDNTKQNSLKSNMDHSNTSSNRFRPKCTFCKHFGHVQSECRKFSASTQPHKHTTGPDTERENTSLTGPGTSSRPVQNSAIVCYGCNTPGYVRTNCPNCKMTRHSIPSGTASSSVELLMTTTDSFNKRRLLPLTVLDLHGYAYVDTDV
ncbi:hypothetical protein JTB14_003885 [Gonioctena quinquepunctata]|nr:hypothetical protein JTB14_003885 [Gonioctena quinquepunctata]